ncbi:MAG TPA: PKD domain-containing protein [Acidimicrobiia bacterium]
MPTTRAFPVIALTAALAIGAFGSVAIPSGLTAAGGSVTAAATPGLRITGPTTLPLGQLVRLQLVATNAPTLAAFETSLRYDDGALDISKVVWDATMPSGAALHGLETPDASDRTTLGAWSCTGSACAGSRQAPSSALAEIDVIALQPGTVHLRLDSTQLVAPDGTLLASSAGKGTRLAATDITFHVGTSRTNWAAPAGSLTRNGGLAHGAPLGVDHSGAPSAGDANGLAAAWVDGAESGNECTADAYADVNGDGCLTMADVQAVAGHASSSGSGTVAHASVTPNTPTTFVVNSTADGGDAHVNGTCSTATAGQCTLRAAVQEANAASGAAEIDFNIPGSGVQTITPQSALPPLTNTSGIIINGFTQPGSSANSDPLVDNAVYGIELAGKGPGTFPAFVIASSHNTFEGLDIHGFSQDLNFDTASSDFNTVVGDMLGLTPTGAYDPKHVTFNDASCIVLQNGASHNQIGAPGNGTRNVISGCDFKGIGSYNFPTSWNVIQNNIVGLDPTGTQRRFTESHGIDITRASEHTMIGGTGTEEGNLVSGNGQAGIEVAHEAATQFNSVIGNLVGTDPTGNTAPSYAANGYWGIHLEGKGDCGSLPCPPDQNHETVEFNTVVDNGRGGVMVDKGTNNSLIAFNKIGVTNNGTAAGNKLFGLNINGGAFKITVQQNIIANNDAGIQVEPDEVLDPNHVFTNTNGNTFTQNSIFNNNQTGTAALGIDLAPFAKVNTSANANVNVNDKMIAPTLSNAQPTAITAATCASCTIEVFLADSAAGVWGSGETYETSAVADSTGNAVIPLPGGVAGHVVTATSTNSNGSTSEFAQNVLVPTSGNGNQPPVASFTQSCDQLVCSFSGSPSHDPDGTVVAWTWDFGDGGTTTGRNVKHTYAAGGTYDVRLTVTDNDGATGSTLLAINPAKLPPLPAFLWKCVQTNCSFDAHISVDNEAPITTYVWNFGDGHTATGLTAQHTYSGSGARTVTLTVTDQGGASAHVSAPVDVNTLTNVGTSMFSFGSHYTINSVYKPITGDFNGDGKTDIIWYAPGPDPDPIWWGSSNGFVKGSNLNISGTYQPLVGDFNGDGVDDILWYAPGPAADHIWFGSSSGFHTGPDPVVNGTYRPAVGDFNGDNFSDIVWDWPTQKSQPIWNGGTTGFTHGTVGLQTRGTPIVGDFNGDHVDDIFWYTGGTGGEHLWLGSGFGLIQAAVAPAIHNSYIPVVGDFNGDGTTDILWYAPGPATDSVWYGSPAGLQPGPHVSANGIYLPLSGDFNGDGKGDAFWYVAGVTSGSSIWTGN